MFREKILSRMEETGVTRKELVERTGINQATVYSFLSGKRAISNKNLECIFNALRLKLAPDPDNGMASGLMNVDPVKPVTREIGRLQKGIKYRIFELGISQTQVATMAGMRPQNLSSFLSGTRPIPSDDLERLIDVLQLKLV